MALQYVRRAAIATFFFLSLHAYAGETLPSPINGITFDEWAAANARLADQKPKTEILKTLGVDASQWEETNAAFLEAFKKAGPGSPAFLRYAEVFANPAVGRFGELDDQPHVQGKLATYEDYARVQAHLTVASEAGEDPMTVLKEHNLTAYEYSQETKRWMLERGRATSDRNEVDRMNRLRAEFEAEYRERYGINGPVPTVSNE